MLTFRNESLMSVKNKKVQAKLARIMWKIKIWKSFVKSWKIKFIVQGLNESPRRLISESLDKETLPSYGKVWGPGRPGLYEIESGVEIVWLSGQFR